MSRIARLPLDLPNGVEVKQENSFVYIKGPKGAFEHKVHASVIVNIEDKQVSVTPNVKHEASRAMVGTTMALIKNMVLGVSEGFERKLTLVGVGYRAKITGKDLELSLGYSHPVLYPIPEGITIEAPSNTEIVIKGADKQRVGQVAAEIRKTRPPEYYKGKGVRYSDEQISLKETKKK